MLDNLLLKLGFKGHDGKARPGNLDASGNLKVKVEDTDPVKVQVSGNDVVIGLLADRPPASEMRGRGYYAWDETDGHKLKYSNGADWVVNQ